MHVAIREEEDAMTEERNRARPETPQCVETMETERRQICGRDFTVRQLLAVCLPYLSR